MFRPHCQSAGVLSKREASRRLRFTGVLRRPPTPFGLCAIECRRDHVSPSTGETNRSKHHCELKREQWAGRAALTIGKSAPLALCSASDAASSRAAPRILPGATKDRVRRCRAQIRGVVPCRCLPRGRSALLEPQPYSPSRGPGLQRGSLTVPQSRCRTDSRWRAAHCCPTAEVVAIR